MMGRGMPWREAWQRRLGSWRRTLDDLLPWRAGRLSLWLALITLVLAMLAILVWLAGRYEASQVQAELERDTQDAVSDLRTALARDVQALQGLQAAQTGERARQDALGTLLRDKREWLRVERRNSQWELLDAEDSPLREPIYGRTPRSESLNEMVRSCLRARQFNGPAYSGSYYLPQNNGLGMEVMELCLPRLENGRLAGYTVLVYSLQELLSSAWATLLHGAIWSPSRKPMAPGWPWPVPTGAGSGSSPRNSCWTYLATPWCCAWTADAPRPTSSPTCSPHWSRPCRSRSSQSWCCWCAIPADA